MHTLGFKAILNKQVILLHPVTLPSTLFWTARPRIRISSQRSRAFIQTPRF